MVGEAPAPPEAELQASPDNPEGINASGGTSAQACLQLLQHAVGPQLGGM